MSAKLSDVLLTIQAIQEIYPFKAEDTFIDLNRENLSRTSQVILRTMDEEGFDIQIAKVVKPCD